MFLVPTQSHQHAFVDQHTPPRPSSGPRHFGEPHSSATTISPLLPSPGSSMERGAPEYSQSGLPSPYPSNFGDTQSEASSVDHPSAAPYAPPQQEVRPNNYSAAGTPTSEYSVYPPSARSSSFPEHIQRSYHPASNHNGGAGGMAQTPTNPSIAGPSPTNYTHGQYPPYANHQQDMSHSYPHPGSAGLYTQPRPDWAGYGHQHAGPITPGHAVFPPTPTTGPQSNRPNQVYSFVPIPGAQQHKRPRRRYEEIERMYKCGWNGCEKAYGTLNHLNAHVTMQSHGQKRTPDEFKEIRKEWKARKKEEEAQRKAEEERQRQAAAAAAQNGAPEPPTADGAQPPTTYATTRPVQLPPIGYQPTQYPAPPAGVQQPLPEYGGNHMYPNYQPPSPYGQPGQQMYNQHNGAPPNH